MSNDIKRCPVCGAAGVPERIDVQFAGPFRTSIPGRLVCPNDGDERHAAPHGPDEPCTCDGCWACAGHILGCTCDIDWDALAELRTP